METKMKILKGMAKKTVDGILAEFNKTISDLEAVEQANNETARQKREEANRLLGEAETAFAEADRANTVAHNLRRLLG